MSRRAVTRLTLEQRVDILLNEGIDNPKKWMAVHEYSEPSEYVKYDCDGHFNSACFDTLRDHHLEETKFLFDVIRELTNRLERSEELLYQASVELSTQGE